MSTRRQARFEEGTSVDVADYLREHGNAEAAEKWDAMNEEYGDLLKAAGEKTAKVTLKVPAGTRVVVKASPSSRALYSGGIPKDGTEGTVTPVSFGSHKRTSLPGPGGGLVYVKFDDGTFTGVSPIDLEKAPAKKKAGCGDELLSRYEEGKPADPTKEMSPEDAKKWRQNTEEYGDKFKAATFRQKFAAVRRMAMEFDTEDALKQYLKEHPGADKSKHTVKKPGGGGEKKDDEGDSKPVSMSREGYKAIAEALDGFEAPGAWGHVISYAISGKPMEAKHVKKVVADIDFNLKNWKTVSETNGWGPKDKKNLTKAKGILENWSGGGGKTAGDEQVAMFEKGKPADPTKEMSPEDAAEWKRQNEKNKDKFKAAEFDPSIFAEGCPDNLDGSECAEWEANTEKYKDVVKDKSALDHLAALDLDLVEASLPGVGLDRSLTAMERLAQLATVDHVANSMVGQIILQQMGGLRKLSAMLGVYYLQYLPNGVEFGFPNRSPTKGNHVKVTLLPSDTYRVEFFKTSWTDLGRGQKIPGTSKLIKKLDDIYAEDLSGIFERQTGYYLHMASEDAEALGELRTLSADFADESRIPDGWDPGHVVPHEGVESEGSETPTETVDGQEKKAGAVIDMMWALVLPDDHYVFGATDNWGDAQAKSYWRTFVDDEGFEDEGPTHLEQARLVTVENVPERVAEKLMDLGTPAQMYDDGYAAWKDVKPYMTGRPTRLAAETKEAATGLYGHTKRIQADCEACIRKAQRTASAIARRAYQKDERVATFLSTHAKRANSLPAKILMSAMEGLGPKFASADPEAMRRQARLEELRAQRQAKLSDGDSQTGEGIEKTKKEAGAPEHGLYGFTDKTATLGLNACTELRASAGRLASNLHKRRAAHHEAITGFLKEHCKTAKCMYAKLLSDSYPAADKLASGTPKTVAEWLSTDI